MQRYAEQGVVRLRDWQRRRELRLRLRDRSRPWDNRPANGTYRDRVATDPAVARARFAVFVDRALKDARARGLTDREIARRSHVATSTFHRWRIAQGQGNELPKADRVRAFCEAVDASVDEAMRVLGMTDAEPEPTAETPLPRDVRVILRRLADPNTPEAEAQFIRMTLQMLAGRAGTEPRHGSAEEAS